MLLLVKGIGLNKENYFINLLNNSFIGDDGAVVGELVYSSDMFCENVHFKRSWMSLEQIAKKAMLVNISDAIAMNAKPLYALINIAIPKHYTPKMLKSLADGFLQVSKEFGIKIIGGDTISNSKLDISITIISQTKNPLFRKKIRPKMLLAYTAELGKSKKNLSSLQRGYKIHSKEKFINILLKSDFIAQARKYIKAGLDISDGLFAELERLSHINRVGFYFFKRIDKRVGCSGEEYEMLFAFDARDKKKILHLAKKTRTKITIFAKAVFGKYTNYCKMHHF